MLLNVRETEDKKVYVSSDFHLGHQKDFVWKTRGFESVQAHDDGIINSVNAIVRPTDILIFLGDFCLNTTISQFDTYLSRFNCQNIWNVWGNHNNPHEKNVYTKLVDAVYPNRQKSYPFPAEVYPLTYKNFTYMGYYLEAILNGQYTVLGHYPIYIWNEMSHGAWMLCGHSHNGCALTKEDNVYGKILDVGWDGHRKPWSLDELSAILNDKRFVPVDHHK